MSKVWSCRQIFFMFKVNVVTYFYIFKVQTLHAELSELLHKCLEVQSPLSTTRCWLLEALCCTAVKRQFYGCKLKYCWWLRVEVVSLYTSMHPLPGQQLYYKFYIHEVHFTFLLALLEMFKFNYMFISALHNHILSHTSAQMSLTEY